ncbi:MAG: hypothetical protein RLZZ342_350 [Candidatus Parcubacteria bacterium]|jgi:hypothetical protein
MSFEKMVRITAAAAALLAGAEKLPGAKVPCDQSAAGQSQDLKSYNSRGPELHGGVRTQETDELILNNAPDKNTPSESTPPLSPKDCPAPISSVEHAFTIAQADTVDAQQKEIENELPHIYDIPHETDPVEDLDTRLPAPEMPDIFEPQSDEDVTIPPPPLHQSA